MMNMTVSGLDMKLRSGPNIDDDFYYLKRFSKKKSVFLNFREIPVKNFRNMVQSDHTL